MMNKKRALSLLLAAAMTASIAAACGTTTAGTGASTTAGTTAAAATTAAAGAETTAAAAAGEKVFEKNVTIQIPVYDRGVEGQAPVDDNYWTKWIQTEFGDKHNITVEYVAIPRSDEVNKFNMLLAAGEAPDLIFHYDYPAAVAYQSAGAIQPVNMDLMKQYAPNYLQEDIDKGLLDYGKLEGTQYFVFADRPMAYNFFSVIRQDWLDKLGLKMPTNLDEYKNVLRAFRDNKLGGENTIPATLSMPTAYYNAAAFRAYPTDEKELALYSDLSVAALPWEPVKKAIQDQNAMYNEGLLSPNFALDADLSKAKADFVTGVAGVYGAYMVKEGIIDVLQKNQPDAKLSYLPASVGFPAGATYTDRLYWPFGMIIGFNAASSEDEVIATMMLLEWMNTPENLFILQNGIEGKTYTKGANGLPVAVADYKGDERMNYNSNKDLWCLAIEGRNYGSEENNLAVIKSSFVPDGFDYLIQDNYDFVNKNKSTFYTDFLFNTAIKSLSDNKATLLEKWQEYYTKLVMCKPDEFEALYAQYSQEYLDAGFQAILDEKSAAYDAMKK